MGDHAQESSMNFKHLIHRDPEINKLEQHVFGQMGQIYKQNCPKNEETNGQIKFISFEEALKELVTQK